VKTISGRKVYFERAQRKTDKGPYQKSLADYYELIGQSTVSAPVETNNNNTNNQAIRAFRSSNYEYPNTVIKGIIERYFQHHLTRHQTGSISAASLASKSYAMKYFTKFLGSKATKANSNELLNEMRFGGFAKHLQRRYARKEISFSTAKTLQNNVAQMIKWAWRNHFIDDLPRNLSDPDLSWRNRNKHRSDKETTIQIYSRDDLHQLINTAYDSNQWCEQRLFLLLGINCGFTPGDIGSLKFRHITITETGAEINKSRTKTGVPGRWTLWSETLRYFRKRIPGFDKQVSSGDKDVYEKRLFTSQTGRRMDRVKIFNPDRGTGYEDIKIHGANHISRRYDRLTKRAFPDDPNRRLSYKYLRKTGASLIAQMDINNSDRIAQVYLAHTMGSIAHQHYIQRDLATLQGPLIELGIQLGFHE
jgi:integrase